MPRYIDADKILTEETVHVMPHQCEKAAGRTFIFTEDIDKIPTADVVEVKHGEWKKRLTYPIVWVCSVCGYSYEQHKKNYCSNCGAKMDGERKEK